MITSEEECKKACNSMEGINRYVVGHWPDSPGCFYYTVNKNCHWNKRTDVKWGVKVHRAVCKAPAPTTAAPTTKAITEEAPDAAPTTKATTDAAPDAAQTTK